jgi:hypothetical protein
MDTRSTGGPILGVPLTYPELRILTGWAAAHPAWQGALRDGLWRWEAPRATLAALALALRPDHPRLAADVAGALTDPPDLGSLSQDEQALVHRLRRTGTGTLVVTVQDGVPTVAPQRHWRWHGGGQTGWFQTQLHALCAACIPDARRLVGGMPMSQLPPPAVAALDRLQTLHQEYTAGVAASLADLRQALTPVLQQAEAWPTIEQRLAKLALIERVLQAEGPAAAQAAAPGGPGAPSAAPPSTTRVLHALEDLGRQHALPVPANTLTWRTGLPRRTVRDALRRLLDSGRAVRLGTVPPYQWTLPDPPAAGAAAGPEDPGPAPRSAAAAPPSGWGDQLWPTAPDSGPPEDPTAPGGAPTGPPPPAPTGL